MSGGTSGEVTIIGINKPTVDTGQLVGLDLFIKTSKNWSKCKWVEYTRLPCDGLTVAAANNYLAKVAGHVLVDVYSNGSLFTLNDIDFKPQYLIQKDIIHRYKEGEKARYLVQWGSLTPNEYSMETKVDSEVLSRYELTLQLPFPNEQFTYKTGSLPVPDTFPNSIPSETAKFLAENIIKYLESNEDCIFVFGFQKWKYSFIFSTMKYIIQNSLYKIGPVLFIAKPSNVPFILSCYSDLEGIRVLPFVGGKVNMDLLSGCMFRDFGHPDHSSILFNLIIATVNSINAHPEIFQKINFQVIISEETYTNIPPLLNTRSKFLFTGPKIYDQLPQINREHLFDISDHGVASVSEVTELVPLTQLQKAAYILALFENRAKIFENDFFLTNESTPIVLTDICMHPFLYPIFRIAVQEFDNLRGTKSDFSVLSGKTKRAVEIAALNPGKRIAFIVSSEAYMKPLQQAFPQIISVGPSSTVKDRIEAAREFNEGTSILPIVLTPKLRIDLHCADIIVTFNEHDFSDWNRYSQFSLTRGTVRLIRLLAAGTHEVLTKRGASVSDATFAASIAMLKETGQLKVIPVDWSRLFESLKGLGNIFEDAGRRWVPIEAIVEELKRLDVNEDIVERVRGNLSVRDDAFEYDYEYSDAYDEEEEESEYSSASNESDSQMESDSASTDGYEYEEEESDESSSSSKAVQSANKRKAQQNQSNAKQSKENQVQNTPARHYDLQTLAGILENATSPTAQVNYSWMLMQKAYNTWLAAMSAVREREHNPAQVNPQFQMQNNMMQWPLRQMQPPMQPPMQRNFNRRSRKNAAQYTPTPYMPMAQQWYRPPIAAPPTQAPNQTQTLQTQTQVQNQNLQNQNQNQIPNPNQTQTQNPQNIQTTNTTQVVANPVREVESEANIPQNIATEEIEDDHEVEIPEPEPEPEINQSLLPPENSRVPPTAPEQTLVRAMLSGINKETQRMESVESAENSSLIRQVNMMSQEERQMFQHVTAVRMRSSALTRHGAIVNDLVPPWLNPYFILENDRRYDDLVTNRDVDLSFKNFDRSLEMFATSAVRAPELAQLVDSDEYNSADMEGKIEMLSSLCAQCANDITPGAAQNYAAMRILVRWMPNFGVRALEQLFEIPPEIAIIARAMLFEAWMMLDPRERTVFASYIDCALADIGLTVDEAIHELRSIRGVTRFTVASLLFFDHQLLVEDFVHTCAFADQLYTVTMCLTRARLPSGYVCGVDQPQPNFWGPSEDFQLLHALASYGVFGFCIARRSDNYIFSLLDESAQPSEAFIRQRALLLVNELFVFFGHRKQMLPLGTVNEFRQMNPEYFEQPMTRVYMKRAIRALSLFGFPTRFTSEENCLRTLQKVANLTFVQQKEFDMFIISLLQRMGFRTKAKPGHSNPTYWVPLHVLESLRFVIDLLDEVRTLNRRGEDAIPDVEEPRISTWTRRHDIELIRVTSDFGLLSGIELARRLGAELSPEQMLMAKLSEAKTLVQATPRNVPELSFLLSITFRINRLRTIVHLASRK